MRCELVSRGRGSATHVRSAIVAAMLALPATRGVAARAVVRGALQTRQQRCSAFRVVWLLTCLRARICAHRGQRRRLAGAAQRRLRLRL